MREAVDETNRRRAKQFAYNQEHGITPQSVVKAVDMELASIVEADYVEVPTEDTLLDEFATEQQVRDAIADLENKMREAARKFEFEQAAKLRDHVRALKQRQLEMFAAPGPASPAAASEAADA